MSKLVLYRKYRPRKFSEVIGQDHVTRTLKNAIERESIAHAYLFCGPRGTGKTTLARLLAKAINCKDEKTLEPCDKCSSCLSIREGRAVDLIEIDAASHRGIDEIRELREGVKFTPAELKYKVYIIDESHQLTSGAANALLKTLEEAPEKVIFILATTEPEKMISTILSRCQRFDLRKLTLPEIIKRLEIILKKEKVKSQKRALEIIATAAQGSIRDAESLLDQILNFVKGEIKEEDVRNLLGLIETEYISKFIDLLIEEKGKEAIDFLNDIYKEGISLDRFYSSLISYLRQLLLLKMSKVDIEDEDSSIITGLNISFTKEEIKKLKKQTKDLEEERIGIMMESFLKAGKLMKQSPIAQLPLEMAIVKITKKRD